MALLQEEIRNFSFKGWQGILGTGNRSTAPDNLTWYEEYTTNSISVDAKNVLLRIADIPPARNEADAHNNTVANPDLIREFDTNNAIHLTPSPNQKAFFATETYGDLSTRLYNFIMPQFVPRVDAGFEDMPSIGYTVRLYQGNPASGGTEITTTIDQEGADVGWFFMYGAGAIVVASDFSGISDPNDLWITGYQYIGDTALDITPSNDTSKKTYVFVYSGADYNVKQKGFQTSNPMIRNKSIVNVYVNGALLNPSDWDFFNVAPNSHPYKDKYANNILIHTSLQNTDIVRIEYTETYSIPNSFFLKLYNSVEDVKPFMIPKSFHNPNMGDGYCSSIQDLGNYRYLVKYTNFGNSNITYDVYKTYPNRIRIGDFEEGFDFGLLNLELEVYINTGIKPSRGSNSTRSKKLNKRLVQIVSTNEIDIPSIIRNRSDNFILSFRFRDTITGEFSEFFDDKVSIRRFPLIVTDETLSFNENVGYFYNSRIV